MPHAIHRLIQRTVPAADDKVHGRRLALLFLNLRTDCADSVCGRGIVHIIRYAARAKNGLNSVPFPAGASRGARRVDNDVKFHSLPLPALFCPSSLLSDQLHAEAARR